jgi:hypothetical protein
MQASHDRYCDESHTPRQACNDALAPAEMRARVEMDPVDTVPESLMAEQAPHEPASSAVREAVAMTEMPQPTSYVTREWERTAAAVAGSERDTGNDDVAEEASGGGVRKIVVMVAAAVAMWVLVRRLRRRRDCESCAQAGQV